MKNGTLEDKMLKKLKTYEVFTHSDTGIGKRIWLYIILNIDMSINFVII